MSGRDTERTRLSERLARDLTDAERAEACARLEPFDEVTHVLEQAAERERALESRGGAEPVPGEAAALAALERALLDSGGLGRSRRARWARVALAAAALVALAFLARELLPRGDEVPGGLFVGSSSYAALAPVGEVDGFSTFRWDGPLPPNGFFQVAVWGADDAAGAAPRAVSDELSEPSWAPAATVLEGLPDAIRWQVRVYEWGRTQIDEVSASARRRSH